MNITSCHIQNVIKAYGQRLERRGIYKLKLNGATRGPSPDTITISPQAKKKQLVEQIASGLVSRAQGENQQEIINENLLKRLGEQFGGEIDIIPQKDKEKGFKFKVITENQTETVRELSFDDLKKMVENLYSDEHENGVQQ